MLQRNPLCTFKGTLIFPTFIHRKQSLMSKLPHVGTTIFTVMSKLAMEHNAINLSQGFPNFPVDEKLIRALESVASVCPNAWFA